MKKSIFLFITLVASVWAFAQDIPEKPNPPRLVNDFANVIPDQQEQQFEAELVQFNNSTSTQITVVTVPSLDGYSVSDYAINLHNKWKVGQQGKDNGIVVLFKPKTNTEKGQVFISVGYGLEGIIPDAIANRDVVDKEMIPRFKNGDIFGGLYSGVQVLKSLASQEYTAEDYHKAGKESAGSKIGGIIIFIIIILISMIFGKRNRSYNGGSSLPFWIAMGMMGSGRSSSGSWGNFSGGSGGFGGFGGGMTGGGGAGGSW